jgi:hypothetical protein
MSSLWTDLLSLHGYITNPKLARRLFNPPSPHQPAPSVPTPCPSNGLLRWTARLCLGIGDGKPRTQ